MSRIERIYTDGACSGNPGPGGWGVLFCYSDGTQHELGDRAIQTTNNQMEMQAAIAALRFFKDTGQHEGVTLYSDSQYLIKGITSWLKGWKKKGWITKEGKAVLNQELWEELEELNNQLDITWEYIKAHAGHAENERCDQIAKAMSQGQKIKLITKSVSSSTINQLDNKIELKYLSSDSSSNNTTVVDSMTGYTSNDSTETLPLPEVRVTQLHHLIETLRIADEVAVKGYLITSSELANLMDINASAVTSRGDHWVWRNWIVSRVRREGNQILWQLERIDVVNLTSSTDDHATV